MTSYSCPGIEFYLYHLSTTAVQEAQEEEQGHSSLTSTGEKFQIPWESQDVGVRETCKLRPLARLCVTSGISLSLCEILTRDKDSPKRDTADIHTCRDSRRLCVSCNSCAPDSRAYTHAHTQEHYPQECKQAPCFAQRCGLHRIMQESV